MAADRESGWTELKEGDERPRERRGTGISKWSLMVLALGILMVVVLGQNTDDVDVDVLWASFSAPLFLVVVLAGLGLTIIWELGTLVFRHRRRKAA